MAFCTSAIRRGADAFRDEVEAPLPKLVDTSLGAKTRTPEGSNISVSDSFFAPPSSFGGCEGTASSEAALSSSRNTFSTIQKSRKSDPSLMSSMQCPFEIICALAASAEYFEKPQKRQELNS